MSQPNKPISIVMADRIDDGLVITFSNGADVLFHTHFL